MGGVRQFALILAASCLPIFGAWANPAKPAEPVVITDDPRGESDLTVCSQNLKNYGSYEDSKTKDRTLTAASFKVKESQLVNRLRAGKCDVIAVQEVLGRSEEALAEALKTLAARLKSVTNRFFEVRVGPPSDGKLGLGFLVAKDRARIVNLASYDRVELPKLSPNQKPRLFSRGPLEIQIIAESRGSGEPKSISIVNFHFKSQRGGQDDPAALEWETYRMEMAEALRRIVERRLKQAFASGSSILLLLGDRNSNFDVASARILEGRVTLESFRANGGCRLSKRGVPLCTTNKAFPQRLFSVLTTNPATRSLPGTFSYQGEYSWLDEILMPAESLPYAWLTATSQDEYASGVVNTADGGTDHAMVYVRLNW